MAIQAGSTHISEILLDIVEIATVFDGSDIDDSATSHCINDRQPEIVYETGNTQPLKLQHTTLKFPTANLGLTLRSRRVA